MKDTPKLSLQKLYGEFSIFVICSFSFLLMLFISQNKFQYATYVAQGLFIVFFVGYTYIIGKIIEFYVVETFFKKKYHTYKWWFWGIISVLLITFFCILGYYNLSKESFWQTIITSGIGGAILLLGLAGKQLINKKWVKKK
jgi:hypothetical protein